MIFSSLPLVLHQYPWLRSFTTTAYRTSISGIMGEMLILIEEMETNPIQTTRSCSNIYWTRLIHWICTTIDQWAYLLFLLLVAIGSRKRLLLIPVFMIYLSFRFVSIQTAQHNGVLLTTILDMCELRDASVLPYYHVFADHPLCECSVNIACCPNSTLFVKALTLT